MTTNFDFVPEDWGDTRVDAVRAESYGRTDPRSCAFYARRVVEQVVIRIFDLERLPLPYKFDLAARIGDAQFRAAVGPDIAAKANAIRRVGNIAVHESRAINAQTAINVLRQLHDLLKWAAYNYSVTPDAVPTSAPYDPSLIPAPAEAGLQPPLSPAELGQLLQTFEAKDAALEQETAASASLQAQLDEVHAQVAAAQAAKAHPATEFNWDEADTRELFIDADLLEAGWTLDQERDREFPVTGMPNEQGKGFVDYVLWGDDGLPLAVIEAKRSRKDPAVGQQQAKLYADCLERMTGRRPIVFWSNGYQHWLVDDAAGYPPRKVSGFFTRDELELMVRRRRTRQPLAVAPIERAIVERHYQLRAIRAIDEAFTAKQRDALLVMATGAGKTRSVVALINQLMNAGWVKRVLFLADRRALVEQAARAFKAHLPDVTTINLVTEKSPDGRVFVSTYPTMMGLINATDGGRRTFGPALLRPDRDRRGAPLRLPEVRRDLRLVRRAARRPDRDAEGRDRPQHLRPVQPRERRAHRCLLPGRGGRRGLPGAARRRLGAAQVPAHRDPLRPALRAGQGRVGLARLGRGRPSPTDVDPEELNRWLFNADTVDKALRTLMEQGHKVAGGDRLGKTIVFAKNQQHARLLEQRFNVAYPEHGGTFARVVVHGDDYAQSLIDDFSIEGKAPHIAISVDMLDTGIDVPEVVYLVFFKLVRSVSKFWQMMGRGTRLCPDLFGPGEDKKNFYVFDFCMNLEFFNQPGDGTVSEAGLRHDTARHLHEVVAGMNLDNFIVRPQREWVQQYAEWEPWAKLSPQEAGEIAEHLGGLPSSVRDDDEGAKRFDLRRHQLGAVQGQGAGLSGGPRGQRGAAAAAHEQAADRDRPVGA